MLTHPTLLSTPNHAIVPHEDADVPHSSRVDSKAVVQAFSFGAADATLLREETLADIFEYQALLHAKNAALLCDEDSVTYADLDARASQLARHLREAGVRRGGRVAILLPRSNELFIAILAVLKSGAAYVPLDTEYPPDRIAYILADCGAGTVLTTTALASSKSISGSIAICLDSEQERVALRSPAHFTATEIGVTPDDICHVIYTSGSTGRPKGVEVSHRSVCHLVRAEQAIFPMVPSDRVFQGFSVAFDASVEEIWLALAAGAMLVVGTKAMLQSGPALPQALTRLGVTVLSCVPTLLSMMSEPIPTLRLLIVGGEACPADLVRRWARPGVRMVNTYGPTEATVIATSGDLLPGEAVTIGRPIPNYRTYLLDQDLCMSDPGQTGELYIAGPGVARGYVGRPDLNAERFLRDPFSAAGGRMYRTGDLGRWTDDGRIEFLGRADSQIKLRGFRIELSEIEAVLMHCPGVLSAAVALREEAPGLPQLVGYVIPRDGTTLDEPTLRKHLRAHLPPYMMPAILEPLTSLPMLPSGKIDRARLPAPITRFSVDTRDENAVPVDEIESRLLAVWRRFFSPMPVQPTDDFFLDLGGHSLLAARVVSQLRESSDFGDLSVTDIYAHPTVQTLSTELRTRRRHAEAKPAHKSVESVVLPVSRAKAFAWCGLAQIPCLYLLLAISSIHWLAPFLVYTTMADRGLGVPRSVGLALAALLALYPLMLALPLAAKWLLLGKIRPGSHALWSGYYLRWWFVQQLCAMAPVGSLAGTPLLNGYLRLLGAKIGRGVYLGSDTIGAFDLIHIGDGSSIGYDAALTGYTVADGRLHLGTVHIGRYCFVGARSVLGRTTLMEDGAVLDDLSLLPDGGRIPASQRWAGSPARPLPPRPIEVLPDKPSSLSNLLLLVAQLVGVFLLPVVYLTAIFPGVLLLRRAGGTWGWAGALLASPLVAFSFVLALCLQIVIVKWLLLGRTKPGTYSLKSGFYLRKWYFDQLLSSSMDVLGPLYATLYLIPWYRALGARLGRGTEISTACSVTPDLLRIGAESFVADAACLGAPRIDRGRLTIAPLSIGKRSFIGNSALIPPGAVIGDSTLVGVLSTTPMTEPGATEPDTSWLGSPAIFLPQRQVSSSFSEKQTFKPSTKLRAQRLTIEAFRVLLPATIVIGLISILIDVTASLSPTLHAAWLAALFPILYLLCGVTGSAIVIAAKWMLLGRYRAAEYPLWSTFVWRTELVTALHEQVADPLLLDLLMGTPFAVWFFRLMGSKIGKRTYLETTCLTEFDLIQIGDDVALNLDCTIQTHLFEDRVMKMSKIIIGDGCTIGAASVVLYDSAMEPSSHLGDLSLLMKGESLPAGTMWEGTPARRSAKERQ